jgi:serine/threonine-protein kinase HipA
VAQPAPVPKQPRLQVGLERGLGSARLMLGQCLWVSSSRAAAFEWSQEARAGGQELSPLMMPLGPGVQRAQHDPFSGIHPLFSDSIPDGFGLRLMNKGLQLAGYGLDQINPMHRLAWVGERGVGALTYEPVIEPKVEPLFTRIFEAAALAAQAEQENFQEMPKEAIRAGGSALGARPKFWAAVGPDPKQVVLGDLPQPPQGYTPSLLKFAPSRGDQNEPYFEAACLALANQHGVLAARGQLLHHAGGAALAVARFDRLLTGERVHTQSVAALLGINFREPTLDYVSLAQLARKLGGSADVERLYRQLCFNVALSMRDDHAKNFAFCMDARGQWSLSPAFDLCPSAGLGLTQEHTTTLNGKGTGISRGDLQAFALAQGLTAKRAREGIENARAAASQFETLAVSLGATKAGAKRWAKSFKVIDALLKPSGA